jgi:hypothetical protein
MKIHWFTNFLLTLIAIALFAHPVHAQSDSPYPFYIEPGTKMLRRMAANRFTEELWWT